MIEVFLHRPFGDPDFLAAILGNKVPPLRPMALPDHLIGAASDRLGPALIRRAGASAPGEALAAEGPVLARIDFLMAAFGADRVRLAAGLEGYPTAAEDVSQSWPDGDDERRRRLREAAEEVMAHYGRMAPSAMPALMHGIGIRALARSRGAASAATVRLGTAMNRADVEPVEAEVSYARHFAVEEHLLRHRRFDGTMSPMVARSVFTSGDAVTVLPFDPLRRAVLLIEQFRAGPQARRDPRPWCLEAVAGRCDKLEPPEATARREAREEAGIELGRMERIATYYPTPGIAAEYITAFVAEADLDAAGGVHGLADEHEDIRTIVVPLASALRAVEDREVNNAPLLLSLLWLAQHYRRLASAWRQPLDGSERSG